MPMTMATWSNFFPITFYATRHQKPKCVSLMCRKQKKMFFPLSLHQRHLSGCLCSSPQRKLSNSTGTCHEKHFKESRKNPKADVFPDTLPQPSHDPNPSLPCRLAWEGQVRSPDAESAPLSSSGRLMLLELMKNPYAPVRGLGNTEMS